MVGSAVDHSMTRGGRVRKSELLCRFGYDLGGRGVLRELTAEVNQNIIVLTSDPEVTGGQSDALHRTLNDPRLLRLSKTIESEFQRRGAAIGRQNDMFCRRHIVLLAVS